MIVKFKTKPTEELIQRYKEKIERFLSAHNLSISIKLRSEPGMFGGYLNGVTETEYLWIEEITVSGQINGSQLGSLKFDKLPVFIYDVGIEEDINDEKIWTHAFIIQGQIYYRLGLCYLLSFKHKDNPYHQAYDKLWDFHPGK